MYFDDDKLGRLFLAPVTASEANWRFLIDRVVEKIYLYLEGERSYQETKKIRTNQEFWQINEEGKNIEELVGDFFSELAPEFFNHTHPGFLGGFNSTPSIASQLGGLISTVLNQTTENQNSPGTLLLAKKVNGILEQILQFSETNLYTSGTSDSNQIAINLALSHYTKTHYNVDIRSEGIWGRKEWKNLVLLASSDCHPSIKKSMEQIGLGSKRMITIPTTSAGQMDISALQQQIYQLEQLEKIPFAIVASAGNSKTGSIDELEKISKICKKQKIWYHIDASYGGTFLLHKKSIKKFLGYQDADSMTWTPSYHFYVPNPCGLLLLKTKKYLTFLPGVITMGDKIRPSSLPNPLLISVLPFFLNLKSMGLTVIDGLLEDSIKKVSLFSDYLNSQKYFAIPFPATLDILCFRYQPPGATKEQINRLVEKIYYKLYHRGKNIISLVSINDDKYFRIIPNVLSSMENLTDLATEIQKIGKT